MTCEELDELFEALADGEPATPDVQAHLHTCARCQARLAFAEAMSRLLEGREVPPAPVNFTQQVMLRVSLERWRVEQVVDAGFNLALAAGILVIAAGAAGLLWSVGLLALDLPAVTTAITTFAPWTSSVVSQAQTMIVALVLLSSVLGLWWWVEGETG